jgi:hypothetical protein
MNVLVMLFLLIGGFNEKWQFTQGIDWGGGRIMLGDMDRDGNYEFAFTSYGGPYEIYFYELHLPDSWEVDTTYYPYSPILWDSGDFDGDGFYNLVMQCGNVSPYWVGISILESPDSFCYPTQEVWRDTVDIGTVQPMCSYDIDKDGIPEIVQTGGEAVARYYIDFSIYESIGDNSYAVKYYFESPETPTSTIAFGDFDSDSLNEFAMGTIDGQYSIFESPGNDSFLPLFVNVQLPTANIKDCFAVSDADGDGKDEFVVKGFTFPDGKIQVFIFEAIGDNTYEIVDTLIFTGFGGSYYGGYSASGDVDGDSIPEIALEGSFRVYMIEAYGNDSFGVFDTLPGNGSGSSVAIYDIDGNGLSEVVISGNNETRIYEYIPPGIKEGKETGHPNQVISISPNPFSNCVSIKICTKDNAKAISMSIFDVSGRLVKDFQLPTSESSDTRTILWDGTDDRGLAVPEGVYFFRLFFDDDLVSVGKLILIR